MTGIGHNSRIIQTVFRTGASQDGHTVISNKLLQDERLKSDTKGFICTRLSYPMDWMVRVAQIIKQFPEGREKIYYGGIAS